jgi:hypothetical protein
VSSRNSEDKTAFIASAALGEMMSTYPKDRRNVSVELRTGQCFGNY